MRRPDPVDDLRAGWDLHVSFGLDHPYVYSQVYGRHSPGRRGPAAQAAAEVLRGLLRRVAEAGRLTRDVETAAQMVHAAGCGVTLTLMAVPAAERDISVSDATREAVLAAVTLPYGDRESTAAVTPVGLVLPAGARRHAVALGVALDGEASPFTDAERRLLHEWLQRLT